MNGTLLSQSGPSIRMASALAFALALGVGAGAPLEAQLISHWELDGDLLDSEGINEGVFRGGVEPLFVSGYDGTARGAVYFDGVDDYVEIPDDPLAPTLALTDNFTLALWFKPASTEQSEKYLLSRNGGGGQYAIIYEYTNDRVDFFAPSRLFGDDPRAGGISEMPVEDTRWHHIAYTYDGETWAGYLDGAQIFAVTLSFALSDIFFAPWRIGAANATDNHVNGAIDDVRIYSVALDAGEIEDLYSEPVESPCPPGGDTHCGGLEASGPPGDAAGTYTLTATATDDSGDPILYTFAAREALGAVRTVGPQYGNVAQIGLTEGSWTLSVTVDDDVFCPDVAADADCTMQVDVVSVPALLAHWELDGDLVDSAGSNDGIFFGGVGGDEPVFVDGHDGTPEGAVFFDGIDDHVQIPPAPELALKDEFTLALWFRPETTDQFQKYLLSRNDSIPGGTGKQYAIIYEYDEDRVDFYAPSRLSGADPRAGGASLIPIPDADWHHVAYTYDGAIWSGYLDGIQVFSTPLSFALDDTFSSSWWIGAANPLGNFVHGAIDDVRIYNFALTDEEVLEITGLESPCPAEGDTHATGLTVEGPLGGQDGEPGVYEVTGSGVDDSGDTILFTFTARPAVGTAIVIGPQESDTAEFDLWEGTWTISVFVDDDPLCPDRAEDATRSTEIVVRWAPALLGQWELDGDLTDSAGVNDGIFFGGDFPSFVDGVDGSPEAALKTDGIDDHVQILPDPRLALTTAFTLALWFRADSTDQTQKYLLSRNATANQYAIIYEYVDDHVEFFGGGAFVGDDPRPVSAMPIGDTEWHHIAYTYDGATFSGYLDGAPLVSSSLQFVLTVFESSWWIGAANPDANHVAGAFDDVRIYNYALSASEVADIADLIPGGEVLFKRGDTDADGTLNITDAIATLNYLFLGGAEPPCLDASDADDSGDTNITDAIVVLGYLFLGGPAPPAPGPDVCGPDRTPSLTSDCKAYPGCP